MTSNRQSTSKESPHLEADQNGTHDVLNAPELSNGAPSVSLWKRLPGFLKKSLVLLSLCIIPAVVLTAMRIAFPEYIVTVQQFEISPEVAAKLSITGKGASDIVIDIL